MTTIEYIAMCVGFILWFWAGYSIGKSRGKAQQVKAFYDVFGGKEINKPMADDLAILWGSDDMELQCKHCGGSYVLEDGYDDKYCCKVCMEADKEE